MEHYLFRDGLYHWITQLRKLSDNLPDSFSGKHSPFLPSCLRFP